MPRKPRPTKINHKRVVRNNLATAADGALHERSALRMHLALSLEMADIEAGRPTKGRYSRVRKAIMERTICSHDEAERAIARGKIYMAEKFIAELPTKRAEACRQLQRIADDNEQSQPLAAVAALREQSRILGLHAPKKIELSQADRETLDLRAVIECLDETGRAALDVVLAQIEAAKAAGRLALPPPDAPVDAELVDEPPKAN